MTSHYVVYDEAADNRDPVIRVAVDSGILSEWAEVTHVTDHSLYLRRKDTDGLELYVPARRIRQAYRRVKDKGPDRLGITDFEAAAIDRVAQGAEASAKTADLIIQIAAIGRVVYR